ncbi:MAG: MFS transporter, partial [Rhodospirillaceae bacterium]
MEHASQDTSPPSPANKPLARGTLWAYGLPGLALAMPTLPAVLYLPSLYAVELGLGFAVVGLCLFLARGLDVITDPIIGVISDRLRSRFGRRKPVIVLGAIIGAPAMLLLFSPPDEAGALGWPYLLTCTALLYLGWTMISIPYTAWGAELSPDYQERSKVTGIREGCTLAGLLLAGCLPVIGSEIGLTERGGITLLAVAAVVLGGLTITWLLMRVPEKSLVSQRRPARAEQTLFSKKGWRTVSGNKPFLRLFSAWVINGLAGGIPATLLVLYLDHVLLASTTQKGLLIFAYFLAGAACIPVWLAVAKRIGKHRCWCLAMTITVLAFMWVPFLEPGDIWLFALICVVTGSSLGADLALPPAMQADVIDLDRLRSGERREGLFFAMWGMGQKLSYALAAGLALGALELFGFSAEAAANGTASPEALSALAWLYGGSPIVLKGIAILLVWGHPLDARAQG